MESVRSVKREDTLTIRLSGEIDHCSAQRIREKLESLLAPPDIHHIRLDFTDVSFMDSSGVGMIIGRYKTMVARNGRVSAIGLHPPVDRLFRMAGLHRIIGIENGERNADS